MAEPERWRLVAGDDLVGVIVVVERNFPWISGTFEATATFDRFADLFRREIELVEADLDRELPEWEHVYRSIRQSLQLLRPDGSIVPEFLLHIHGSEAWFRYSDEPFDAEPGP
jgi:hypothetical protein